ncbi:hypothetical protein DFH11DRAFT_1557636 [Phellopilus nigrolimitatus]|nr:hypothetical protein DFH11DRAFT_1557636 [Phellopilus nigrolimitatus]
MAGPVQWNFSIDDTSPMFSYVPYADTGIGNGLLEGWQTWYSGSNYLKTLGESPIGDSFHLTSLSGASVSLSFYGTGVALYGSANCSYDATFDGTMASNATLVQGVFFSTSNATAGFHNVTLTAKPDDDNQILQFDRAIVYSVANSTATSPVDLTISNQNTSTISYTGEWTPDRRVSGIPSLGSEAPFHSTSSFGASAALNFTGRTVALYGSSTNGHGQYLITLDGQEHFFNGTSEWLVGDMLMFYQDGLDENATHLLNVTNFSNDEGLSLNSVQIKQFASALNTPSSVHKRSIVGMIVGPVVAFVTILSLVCLYFWAKHRARHAPKDTDQHSVFSPSILLLRKFRQKDDPLTPYVVKLDQTHSNTFESVVSSDPKTYFLNSRGNRGIGNEKARPQPVPSSLNDHGINAYPTIERRPPRSIPATYLPSEPICSDYAGSPVDTITPSYPPRTYAPPVPTAENMTSSAQSAHSSAFIDRIMELVVQRIDTQRFVADAGSARNDSVSHLPPYPEDV